MIARQVIFRRSLTTALVPAIARIVLPNAKSNVPLSNSQGTKRRKVCCGVFNKSTAPAQPPATLVTSRGIMRRAGASSRFMYARVLAASPGQSATVLVAFACTGGTPMNKSAGNEMKLPPPANAFKVPAIPAAKNRNRAWVNCNLIKYQKTSEYGTSALLTLCRGRPFVDYPKFRTPWAIVRI